MQKKYNFVYSQAHIEKDYNAIVRALAKIGLSSSPSLSEQIVLSFSNLDKNNIRGNKKIGSVSGGIVTHFDEMNKENYDYIIPNPDNVESIYEHAFYSSFEASNGNDLYLCDRYYSTGYRGIYYKDLRTGKIEHIYGNQYYEFRYEDKNGYVYAMGTHYWDSSYSTTNSHGILRIKGKEVTVITPKYISLRGVIEMDDNEFYFYPTGTGNYVSSSILYVKINNDNSFSCEQIYSGLCVTLTKVENKVYGFARSENNLKHGVMKLNKNQIQHISELCLSTSSAYKTKDKNNNIYAVSGSKHLFVNTTTDEVKTIVFEDGFSPNVLTSNNNSNVYASNSSSSYKGVYLLNDGTSVKLNGSDNLYNVVKLIRDSKNNDYLSSDSANVGLFCVDGDSVVQLTSSGSKYYNKVIDDRGREFLFSNSSYNYAVLNGVQTEISSVSFGGSNLTLFKYKNCDGFYIIGKTSTKRNLPYTTGSFLYIHDGDIDGTLISMRSGFLITSEKWDYFYVISDYSGGHRAYYVKNEYLQDKSINTGVTNFILLVDNDTKVILSDDGIYPSVVLNGENIIQIDATYYKITGGVKHETNV